MKITIYPCHMKVVTIGLGLQFSYRGGVSSSWAHWDALQLFGASLAGKALLYTVFRCTFLCGMVLCRALLYRYVVCDVWCIVRRFVSCHFL